MNLSGKHMVITGAAGVLGFAAAEKALSLGAKVILCDIAFPDNFPLSGHDNVTMITLDLTNQAATVTALEGLERIDGVLNIAGGFDMGPSVHETSDDQWNKLFAMNVTTLRNMVKGAVPKMIAQGRGTIVNVGANAATSGIASMSTYCASKAVVMRLTESMAGELKDKGINVNAVLPSILDTPTNRADMPDANFDTWVKPEELANVMCFLSSDDASAIHGSLLPVTGRV